MRVVTPISLVMAYYENAGMLQRHYKRFCTFDPVLLEGVHMVIVDDGSPTKPALPLKGPPAQLSLQIYRMDCDIRWNQDACRNIGVAHAETNWVLLTDMDHEITAETWTYLVTREWDAGIAYKFRRVSAPRMDWYKPHPNSWFMSRKLYEAAGGYDERFAGLYGTDGDFRDSVRKVAKEIKELKQSIIRVPREVVPDASTTHYLRKQPEDREGLARVFAQRESIPDWRPLNRTFPYHRVYP